VLVLVLVINRGYLVGSGLVQAQIPSSKRSALHTHHAASFMAGLGRKSTGSASAASDCLKERAGGRGGGSVRCRPLFPTLTDVAFEMLD
jgi:hypothetical protein